MIKRSFINEISTIEIITTGDLASLNAIKVTFSVLSSVGTLKHAYPSVWVVKGTLEIYEISFQILNEILPV